MSVPMSPSEKMMSPMRWLDHVFLVRVLAAAPGAGLEDRFHRGHQSAPVTAGPENSSSPRPASTRTGSPRGSVRVPGRCPAGRPDSTGKGAPAKKPRSQRPTASGDSPPRAPGEIEPMSMACSPSNVPDRSSWVNIRSSRYVSSPTSSQKRTAPRPSTASGVPHAAASSERHPPTRGPEPVPPARIAGFARTGGGPASARQHRLPVERRRVRHVHRDHRPVKRGQARMPPDEREERGEVRAAEVDDRPRAHFSGIEPRENSRSAVARRARRRSRPRPGRTGALDTRPRAAHPSPRNHPVRSPTFAASSVRYPACSSRRIPTARRFRIRRAPRRPRCRSCRPDGGEAAGCRASRVGPHDSVLEEPRAGL